MMNRSRCRLTPEEYKSDGANLEQYLLACWGREGRVGYIIIHELLELAKEHGYDNVYHAIKIAAEANVRNIRYVKGILAKQKKKTEPPRRQRIACSCGHVHFADEPCPMEIDDQITVADALKNVAALINQYKGGTP